MSTRNSTFMGIYFHVQLLSDLPPTTKSRWCKPDGSCRHRWTILPKQEFEGLQSPQWASCPAFSAWRDAYLAVQELHDSYRRKLEDADRERDELFANPALGDWSVAHKFITNLEPYADLIRNTLSAVESISGNSNVKARIVWC